MLTTADGARIASPRWKDFAVSRPISAFAAKPTPQAASSVAQDVGMEMTIAIELAHMSGNSRRPYVAIWIEDKDKFPVRTLALWYQKERWLPELRAWYRDDRMRAMAEGNSVAASIASATRPSGKYTVKWDGKDNAGKLVKAGKYTV